MTALPPKGSLVASSCGSLLQKEDVVDHPETSSDDVISIVVGGKSYDFSREMLETYPKLKDPAMRYTLQFDTVLPLIYGYPASVLPKTLLDERGEKEIFLSNCEFLGIRLSDDVILHLSSESEKQIEECSKFVIQQAGRKGKDKMRFSLKKEVRKFCSEAEKAFREIYDDIKPIDIVEKLELGEVRDLVLHDWKSKNSVLPFIQSFAKFFL